MSYLNFINLLRKICSKVLTKLLFAFKNKYKSTKIVYKSDNFLIINKAYDLKINSNNKNEHTLQTFIKNEVPRLASNQLHHEYYFMHRLDYSTSGLMCIPVHKKACQEASRAMQNRQCKKYYIALVRGYLSSNLLDLNHPIGRDSTVEEIEKMCVLKNGRTARTLVVVLERGFYDNYPATKILVRPISGRRHQIRVHCSHIGHTIVGDFTYSNKKDVCPVRMYLHALRLVIPNKIEDINIQTVDPFTENEVREWHCTFPYFNLDEAFEKLDAFL